MRDKEPLTYTLDDMGYQMPHVEEQKPGRKRDKKHGRRKRRRSPHSAEGKNMDGNTQEHTGTPPVTPAGGEAAKAKSEESGAMDTIMGAARSTGEVLRDDVGHPILKGVAYGFGGTAGALGALAIGTQLGINPFTPGS